MSDVVAWAYKLYFFNLLFILLAVFDTAVSIFNWRDQSFVPKRNLKSSVPKTIMPSHPSNLGSDSGSMGLSAAMLITLFALSKFHATANFIQWFNCLNSVSTW